MVMRYDVIMERSRGLREGFVVARGATTVVALQSFCGALAPPLRHRQFVK